VAVLAVLRAGFRAAFRVFFTAFLAAFFLVVFLAFATIRLQFVNSRLKSHGQALEGLLTVFPISQGLPDILYDHIGFLHDHTSKNQRGLGFTGTSLLGSPEAPQIKERHKKPAQVPSVAAKLRESSLRRGGC
jgi:hypothetical protein